MKPIKIEKSSFSVSRHFRASLVKKNCSHCFVVTFVVSVFQTDNSDRLYVLGHKYFWGPFQRSLGLK